VRLEAQRLGRDLVERLQHGDVVAAAPRRLGRFGRRLFLGRRGGSDVFRRRGGDGRCLGLGRDLQSLQRRSLDDRGRHFLGYAGPGAGGRRGWRFRRDGLGGHDACGHGANRGARQEAAHRRLRREAAAHDYSGVHAS
jgi:hypothetical protein